MIGLDAHVLVRFLVQDHAAESEAAARAVRGATERRETIFLSGIVLCQTVWILESVYGHPREAIAGMLDRLLLTDGFEIEGRDQVAAAQRQYRRGQADFADYLIGQTGLRHGCSRTLTFDRLLLIGDEFGPPPPPVRTTDSEPALP